MVKNVFNVRPSVRLFSFFDQTTQANDFMPYNVVAHHFLVVHHFLVKEVIMNQFFRHPKIVSGPKNDLKL